LADSKIIIEVGVKGDAEIQLRKIGDAAQESAGKSSKAFADAGRIFDNYIANLASSATQAAFNLVSKGVDSLVGFLNDSIHSAAEAEEATHQLTFALQSAGVTSAASAKKFLEFADALQSTTKFSDDAITSAAALIEQIAKLDEDGLEKATLAATNLSAALGIDLQSAATAVGKVAIGEASILNKYGFEIDKAASNADNFARALEFVNTKFGGAAAAQINTYSGATALLANQYDNLKEAVGNVIVQNPVVIELFKQVSAIITDVTKSVQANDNDLRKLANTGLIEVLIPAVQLSILALDMFYKAMLAVAIGYLQFRESVYDNTPFLRLTDGFKQSAAESRKLKENLLELYGATDKKAENFVIRLEQTKIKLREVDEESTNAAIRAVQAGEQEVENTKIKETALTDVQIQELQRRKAEKDKARDEDIAAQVAYTDYLLATDKFANEELIKNNLARTIAKAEAEGASNEKILQLKKKAVDIENGYDRDRFNAAKGSLDALSTLQNAKTREIAAVGKAAAIARATIDTYTGAQAAAAAVAGIPYIGPVLAAAAAAAFIAAGIARVAQISGVELAGGLTEVPPGYGNDSFGPTYLQSGERVVDAGTNQDLKSFLATGGSQVEILGAIYRRLGQLETRVNVFVGGRLLVDEVRTGLEQGRTLDVAI